ncbi:MAG: Helix-turn-helix domain [Planctomycetota bacterium]|jgi:transcriptional regulator with XRE-family HTH domain
MRRLHLKLFYLRTRVKREAQGVTARTLGVRPATMSHLEQGRSVPTIQMLHALCQHYDVTPSFLMDDDRPIEPQARDRWSERGNLIAKGSWLEVQEGALLTTNDGVRLAPIMHGARHYDAMAQAQRMGCGSQQSARELDAQLAHAGKQKDGELEEMLRRELMAQRKPRATGKRPLLKPAPSASVGGRPSAREA